MSAQGDSMPPHENGSYIVVRYIEKLDEIVNKKNYIIITCDKGIVYKRINKNKENVLILESDNPFYQPYSIKATEALEIWLLSMVLAIMIRNRIYKTRII